MNEDFSTSIAWEGQADTHHHHHLDQDGDDAPLQSTSNANPNPHHDETEIVGKSTTVKVVEAQVELEGTKDTFVSYLVVGKTDLPTFSSGNPSSRRRFQDFTFLREQLTRDYPACVVPPLPDKHRMEYLTGDRFSNEFIERRRIDLQRFLERLARHPRLSRTPLFRNFLESTEWNVYKHTLLAHPSDPDPPSSLLDNLSDTLLNAFSKVRKPDARFVEMRLHLDQFEEGLASIERLAARSKTRLADLSGDYEDLAGSVQGLGYLESGITEPLGRFEGALMEFGTQVKENGGNTADPFLEHLHSLVAYSGSFRSVLKLRDQKQLDFEELSAYLANLVGEKERLQGGFGYGLGLGNYLKEKVEGLRGGEGDGGREMRLRKLEGKIKELQDAVLTSEETSKAFNVEVVTEHAAFQVAKRAEMKELLRGFCDGQIELHRASVVAWDKTIPAIAKISVEP